MALLTRDGLKVRDHLKFTLDAPSLQIFDQRPSSSVTYTLPFGELEYQVIASPFTIHHYKFTLTAPRHDLHFYYSLTLTPFNFKTLRMKERYGCEFDEFGGVIVKLLRDTQMNDRVKCALHIPYEKCARMYFVQVGKTALVEVMSLEMVGASPEEAFRYSVEATQSLLKKSDQLKSKLAALLDIIGKKNPSLLLVIDQNEMLPKHLKDRVQKSWATLYDDLPESTFPFGDIHNYTPLKSAPTSHSLLTDPYLNQTDHNSPPTEPTSLLFSKLIHTIQLTNSPSTPTSLPYSETTIHLRILKHGTTHPHYSLSLSFPSSPTLLYSFPITSSSSLTSITPLLNGSGTSFVRDLDGGSVLSVSKWCDVESWLVGGLGGCVLGNCSSSSSSGHVRCKRGNGRGNVRNGSVWSVLEPTQNENVVVMKVLEHVGTRDVEVVSIPFQKCPQDEVTEEVKKRYKEVCEVMEGCERRIQVLMETVKRKNPALMVWLGSLTIQFDEGGGGDETVVYHRVHDEFRVDN